MTGVPPAIVEPSLVNSQRPSVTPPVIRDAFNVCAPPAPSTTPEPSRAPGA